jgi:hypothetical protein
MITRHQLHFKPQILYTSLCGRNVLQIALKNLKYESKLAIGTYHKHLTTARVETVFLHMSMQEAFVYDQSRVELEMVNPGSAHLFSSCMLCTCPITRAAC